MDYLLFGSYKKSIIVKNVCMKFDMKSFRINRFIDFMFFAFSIFLIVFAYARYLRCSLFIAWAVASILCILLCVMRQLFLKKKSGKETNYKIHKEKVEQCIFVLITNSHEDNLSLFQNMLLTQNNDVLILNSNLIKFNDSAIYLGFDTEKLNSIDAFRAIKTAYDKGAKDIKLLCPSCQINDKIKLERIENIKVQILEKEQIYTDYFDGNDNLLHTNISFRKQNGIKLKELKEMSLSREKSKKYFLYGLLIFFCSLIVRYNFYYVFMSSILFLLAILSRRHSTQNYL